MRTSPSAPAAPASPCQSNTAKIMGLFLEGSVKSNLLYLCTILSHKREAIRMPPRLLQPRYFLSSRGFLLPITLLYSLQIKTACAMFASSIVQQAPAQQGGQQFAQQAYAPAPPPQQQAPAPTSQPAASASSNGSPPAPAVLEGVEVRACSSSLLHVPASAAAVSSAQIHQRLLQSSTTYQSQCCRSAPSSFICDTIACSTLTSYFHYCNP